MRPDKRGYQGWRSRLMGLLAIFLGSVTAAPVSAGPAEWDGYARFVGTTLQQYLAQDNDPAAQRFHAFLDRHAQQDGKAVPDLVIRVWLNSDGQIIRLGIPELGNSQASQDLYHILTSRPLNRLPPQAMPMPLILRLQLSYKV